ncbi:uncharacterized protein LOC100203072 isoform X2 [Hydra vulgaris]|uniref:Uncharacterized protein LOC100203072 isoform X2 n=1 Tax=Hydra vulgaris TaxID=6087 RepID=A0ABM4BYW1_HYDVU
MDGDQMLLDSLNHEHQEGGIKTALMTIQKHGCITPKQVHSFFTDMGETYTQKEVNKLIYELDIKDRDTLDLREFLTLIQLQLKVNDTEEEVIEAFKVFDKDQSGFLECSELRRIMVNLGDKLTDDEVDSVIVKSDIDGDGSCNYEEFTRILMREKKFITRTERETQALREEEERFRKERKERMSQNKVVIIENDDDIGKEGEGVRYKKI